MRRNYFFTPTVDHSRFLTEDEPTEQTMRDFTNSVGFLEELSDAAKLDKQGFMKLASDQDVINQVTPDDGYSYAVQPHQLGLSGGIDTYSFAAVSTNGFIRLSGTRWVFGNQVVILMDVVFSDSFQSIPDQDPQDFYTMDSLTVNDVIPQDFKGYKWFRFDKFTSLVAEGNATGDFGAIKINDLNSYNQGSETKNDFTELFLSGNEKGVNRAFHTDQFYTNNPPLSWTEVEELYEAPSNYIPSCSPKDITSTGGSALNIEIVNASMFSGLLSIVNTIGTLSIEIRGSLL